MLAREYSCTKQVENKYSDRRFWVCCDQLFSKKNFNPHLIQLWNSNGHLFLILTQKTGIWELGFYNHQNQTVATIVLTQSFGKKNKTYCEQNSQKTPLLHIDYLPLEWAEMNLPPLCRLKHCVLGSCKVLLKSIDQFRRRHVDRQMAWQDNSYIPLCLKGV